VPDVNYAILATPPGFRPPPFKACIDMDKHVFVEKPVAVDPWLQNHVRRLCQRQREEFKSRPFAGFTLLPELPLGSSANQQR
jgi:hypothetical protein